MSTRRSFLVKGSLATTALLAAKPMQVLAKTADAITEFDNLGNSLVFVHTSVLDPTRHQGVIHTVNQLRNNSKVVLLKASPETEEEAGSLVYDACMNNDEGFSLTEAEYKIVKKGNIRVGVISVGKGEMGVYNKVNRLATHLKQEKNCQVVVCLSQLGHKNKYEADDLKLAAQSENLDIIIGGDARNTEPRPIITGNRKNAEVIIHCSAGEKQLFGSIRIDFDNEGKKKRIDFPNNSRSAA